jgi:hypothetical protein
VVVFGIEGAVEGAWAHAVLRPRFRVESFLCDPKSRLFTNHLHPVAPAANGAGVNDGNGFGGSSMTLPWHAAGKIEEKVVTQGAGESVADACFRACGDLGAWTCPQPAGPGVDRPCGVGARDNADGAPLPLPEAQPMAMPMAVKCWEAVASGLHRNYEHSHLMV